MKERLFRFKQFSVSHSRSAMKVGVDGVLVGAWGDVSGCKRILDAGCGCGLIALMCAMRNTEAKITGIEIEHEAAAEAAENFAASPWCDRLTVVEADLTQWRDDYPYDLIISNPPFFNSGVEQITDSRTLARHSAGLSPLSLLGIAQHLLRSGGRLILIMPDDDAKQLIDSAKSKRLMLKRITHVRGHETAPCKRALCEFVYLGGDVEQSEDWLTLNHKSGEPTEQYRALCKDFYLKF